MGILFAIFTSILLGSSNIFFKKAYRDFSPAISFFLLSLLCFIFWLIPSIFLGIDFHSWLEAFIVGTLSGILGQAIYIHVLSKGQLSLTATILSSFSIYTIIFSMIINHERPSPLILPFMLVIIFGTLIVALPNNLNFKELKNTKYILIACLAAMGIGLSDTLAKGLISRTSLGTFLFFVTISQFLVSFIYLKLEKEKLSELGNIYRHFRDYRFAFIGSLFACLSTLFLFLSFNLSLASVASPIAASYPVITVILAYIFLNERIAKKDWFGIVLVIVSLIAIGFIQP